MLQSRQWESSSVWRSDAVRRAARRVAQRPQRRGRRLRRRRSQGNIVPLGPAAEGGAFSSRLKTGLGSRADGLERRNRSLAGFHCAHRFRRFVGDLLHPRALFRRLRPRPAAAASKSAGVCDDRNTLRIRGAVRSCECHRRARHRPDLHPTRFVHRFFRTFAPRPVTRPTAASPRSSKFKTTRVLPLPSALNTASARPGRLAWNGSARAARGSGRPGCAIARNFRLERDMSDPRPLPARRVQWTHNRNPQIRPDIQRVAQNSPKELPLNPKNGMHPVSSSTGKFWRLMHKGAPQFIQARIHLESGHRQKPKTSHPTAICWTMT